MEMTEFGHYLPALKAPTLTDGLYDPCCPFFDSDNNEDTLALDLFNQNAKHHTDVGWYQNLWAGYAIDKDFRSLGSSGGLTNWLATELLHCGYVDGVIHVKPNNTDKPGQILFEYGISRTINDIKQSAKSKYYPVEISKVMELIQRNPGTYVFIGLPCFVKAVRLLSQHNTLIRDSIKFYISLFCGHLKASTFAEYLAWQLNIEPKQLTDFDFRTKINDLPANKYAVTATGIVNQECVVRQSPSAKLMGTDWGEGFFKLKACDYCDDIVGETADVSFGDAWLPKYVDDSKGTNIVIARNSMISELLIDAFIRNVIKLESITVNDVHFSQDSNFRHRRDGLAYRLAKCSPQNIWFPTKRVKPADSLISSQRKRIQDLRMQMRESSHKYFLVCKRANNLRLFNELMAPMISAYRQEINAARLSNKLKFAAYNNKMTHILSNTRYTRYYLKRLLQEYHKFRRLSRKLFKNALILPPDSPGSVGDDAMVSSTIAYLRNNGFKRIGLLLKSSSLPFNFTEVADEYTDISKYWDKDQTPSPYDILKDKKIYDYFYIIGADVMDGYYSDLNSHKRLMLAYEASKLGMKATLLGFSYNAEPAPLSVRGMKDLSDGTRICIRDPISRKRFDNYVGLNTEAVADVAFLLTPASCQDHELVSWLQHKTKNNDLLIGINAIFTSIFFLDRSNESQDHYIAFYSLMISKIVEAFPQAHFVFISHDYRPNGVGEGPVLEYIFHSLPDELKNRVFLPRQNYSAAEIKWITGKLDFVISSRMHLAIAAIGQCTPVFCFEYQGKFQGLFELCESLELLSSLEEILQNPQSLIERILESLRQRKSIREKFLQKLPYILKLAEKNFDF